MLLCCPIRCFIISITVGAVQEVGCVIGRDLAFDSSMMALAFEYILAFLCNDFD